MNRARIIVLIGVLVVLMLVLVAFIEDTNPESCRWWQAILSR